MSLHRIAYSKVVMLLASAILLSYLFAVFFQMFILWGKGFELSETLPNALVSADLSWFILPTFYSAFGAIIGALFGRQSLIAVLVTVIVIVHQCISSWHWVAALFSIPAVLIALSPQLSSYFVLGNNNV